MPKAVSKSFSKARFCVPRIIAKAALSSVIGCLAAIVVGQPATGSDITQSPPPITFPDWKDVSSEEGVTEYLETFPSALQSRYPENNVVSLRVVLPSNPGPPVPCVLVLHYWGAKDLKIEHALADELAHNNIATAIMTLPYHMERTPHGFRSGQLAIVADVDQLIENVTQSVLDVRRSVDFLATRKELDPNRIGLAGTSLGSLVSALSYAVEPRFSSAAFILGGVDFAHIIWHSSIVASQRDILRRKGLNEEKLATALHLVEPLTYLSNRKTGSTFVIGGRYDTVIPPEDTRKLIASLSKPNVLWLDTGHYGGVFVEKKVLRTVGRFFSDHFAGKTYNAPRSINAPTVRIALTYSGATGFQVGAGLDLWRANRIGQVFSTLFATPRGPQLFLGLNLDHGLAVGGFAGPRRVSPGLFWSTVL